MWNKTLLLLSVRQIISMLLPQQILFRDQEQTVIYDKNNRRDKFVLGKLPVAIRVGCRRTVRGGFDHERK